MLQYHLAKMTAPLHVLTMTHYTTLDHLPDLTLTQMVLASNLVFEPYSVPSLGWDRMAGVSGNNAFASLHAIYKFTAVQGATYDLFSTSFFDPFLLRIYDRHGKTIVANDEQDDGPPINLPSAGGSYMQDVIYNWVAPYSGTYFVDASWNQSSFFRYYSLSIYENLDTANDPFYGAVGTNIGHPKPMAHDLTDDPLIDAMTTGYKWQLDATRVIDFSISSGFSGEYWVNPAEVSASLKAALGTFSALANVEFNDLGHFADPSLAAQAGSEINLSLDSEWAFFSDSSQWAQAFFPSPGNAQWPYEGAAGDVYLNINSAANTLPSYAPGSTGWFLLLHELGHSLGLKHPHDDGGNGRPTFTHIGFEALDIDWATIMSYNDDAFDNLVQWDPATPMVLDALALQYLYGPNTRTHAGDTLHALTASGFYTTLWDASGIDTLDVSAQKEGWTIYLPDFSLSELVPTLVGLASPSADLDKLVPETIVWLLGDFENVRGSPFDDLIFANGLDNAIDGGAGIDTVVWNEARDQYTLERSGQAWWVQHNATDTRDRLVNVERLSFDDHVVALDLAGHAGTVAKTLGAVFGPASVHVRDHVGIGLHYLDVHAYSPQSLMQFAIEAQLGPTASHEQVVNLLYTHVVGHAPTEQVRQSFVHLLDSGAHTVASLGLMAADTDLNVDNINLVGLAQTGLAYQPFVG